MCNKNASKSIEEEKKEKGLMRRNLFFCRGSVEFSAVPLYSQMKDFFNVCFL
jgi:hypothetical protein